MSKRVDHDATQEVSSSQLVPDRKPPVYPNVPNNDASMWLSAPVSADDFVSGPKKKPDTQNRRRVVVALTVVALLGVGVAGAWYAFLRSTATETSARETPSAAPESAGAIDDTTAAAVPAADAGVEVVALDAATAPIPDVASPSALEVDAVSAADPAPKKPAKKRPATKKKVVKKKTATKRR